MAFWLIVHVVVWTIYGTISSGPADIHHDMAEAYSWGREFQLGYYKHPPFWAWVVGAWFLVMPRADWAYYLLCAINSALGLWAAWLIAGRLIEDRTTRLTAMLLLQLTPFYNFMALKYNANTIMLSLWAWAIYFSCGSSANAACAPPSDSASSPLWVSCPNTTSRSCSSPLRAPP